MSKIIFENKIMPVSQKMYRYALSILKDTDTAKDVVQECLLKIWKKRDLLTGISCYDSWAMRITRNQCYDWVKTNRFTIADSLEFVSESDETDHESILNDSLNWLDKILKTISPKNREVFHLREVEEMTYQEIAEVMSLSLSDVKVSIHRTRQKIKYSFQKIEGYGIAN
ncbi:MAG: RNA polymerase sigma factor [Bacteroidales bacterium]|nr:RNA polymerase sigma factor [Bacteroidales bacterium]